MIKLFAVVYRECSRATPAAACMLALQDARCTRGIRPSKSPLLPAPEHSLELCAAADALLVAAPPYSNSGLLHQRTHVSSAPQAGLESMESCVGACVTIQWVRIMTANRPWGSPNSLPLQPNCCPPFVWPTTCAALCAAQSPCYAAAQLH